MSFREWMERNNVSIKSSKKYSAAIYGAIPRMGLGHVPEGEGIEAFEDFLLRVRADESFRIMNEKGHRMYSSALRHFENYLRSLERDLPIALQDCEAIEQNPNISTTQRQALIQARLGQGRYRAGLIELWHGNCSVTGYPDTRLLIASHIKPWYRANDEERLDPHNGLLLTPNLDKVFDQGLISFNPNDRGRILFSPHIVRPEALGLSDDMRIGHMDEGTAKYLLCHRETVFLSTL